MQIEVQHGDEPKQIFHIKKDRILLGRSTKCDIQLHYPGISRDHLIIEWRENNIYVTDNGSTNGVFIDGERIVANKEVLYQNYLQLMAGETNVIITPPVDTTGSFTLSTMVNVAAPRSQKTHNARTTSAPQTPRHAPYRLPQGAKTTMLPYFFAAILVGGILVYYQNKEPVVIQVEKPVVEKKTFAIPANFEELKTYDELWKTPGCKSYEEKTICQQLKDIWFPKEHLLIKENVYIFVNLTKELSYRGLRSDNLKAIAEILLSNLSTHPLVRALDRPAYALGFTDENGNAQLKFVLTQNMNGIPVLDLQLHKSVFSRAMIGEEWLFQKIIQPELAIKPL